MKLILTPQHGLPGQPETTIFVAGNVLTVSGQIFDLTDIPDGGEGWPDESDHPFVGKIVRQNGKIVATIRVTLDETVKDDQSGPWVIEDATGSVEIPAIRKEVI